jgi:FHA domain
LASPVSHVGVEVGDGLVARFGDALVLVLGPAEHRQRAEAVLNAVEAAAAEGVAPGMSVAHRLAAVVAGEAGSAPAFGAVAPLEDGYVVLLHGPVSAEITSPLGVVRLSGKQAVTWVDHKVDVPLDRLSVTSHDHPVQVDPMSDLRAGLVPGSGFVLTPGKTTDGPAMSPSVRETSPANVASTGRPEAGAGPSPRSARSTEVLGQPVGHLVATDGLRVPLDRSYVLGREPEADPAVASGSATPVRLSDDENLISRVHTYVSVEAGRVSVQDADSANGTFVAAPGDEEWARVGNEPVELPPTWSMRVGNQILTYVSAEAGT